MRFPDDALHDKHEENSRFTAFLANGMYERQYQVMAKYCIMQKRSAKPLFFHQKAAHRVNANDKIMTIVAIKRFSLNIFFNCFKGPSRKHVLANEIMLPKV